MLLNKRFSSVYSQKWFIIITDNYKNKTAKTLYSNLLLPVYKKCMPLFPIGISKKDCTIGILLIHYLKSSLHSSQPLTENNLD